MSIDSGQLVVCKVGETSTEANATVISNAGEGLHSVTPNDNRPSREVPGGGPDTHRETLDYSDATCSIVADSNTVTDPVFEGCLGKYKHVWVYPKGEVSGEKGVYFIGRVAEVIEEYPGDNAIVYTVNMDVDSEPTELTVA